MAVAPVDRQWRPVCVQLVGQRGQQGTVFGIDRAYSAQQLIVPGNLQKPPTRNVLATDNVFQERQNIIRPLRPAERNQQESVVGRMMDIGCGFATHK